MVTRQHIEHNTTIHNTKANNIELGAVIDVIHAPQIQHTTGHRYVYKAYTYSY